MRLTKEGIEVKVGQIWEDLDKRMRGRRCKVVGFTPSQAIMESVTEQRRTFVSFHRMYKNSTGWKLVE